MASTKQAMTINIGLNDQAGRDPETLQKAAQPED